MFVDEYYIQYTSMNNRNLLCVHIGRTGMAWFLLYIGCFHPSPMAYTLWVPGFTSIAPFHNNIPPKKKVVMCVVQWVRQVSLSSHSPFG